MLFVGTVAADWEKSPPGLLSRPDRPPIVLAPP